MDLLGAAAGAAALQKLRQLGSFGDHHFAESGGGVVAQSRGFVARGATSASKRVLEVASLTRRAFEQLVSGFGSKPAAVVPAVVAGQFCGEGASTVMSPSTLATSAFGGTPKLPEEQELPFGHRVMQPQPHHHHQSWQQQQFSAHGSCPPTPELQLASRLSLQQLKTVKKESQASLKKAMSDMEDKAKALQSVLDKNAKLPESLAVGEHAGLLSLISSLREACNTAIAGVHSWTLTSMSEQENAAAELLAQMEGAADKAGTLRACILEAVNAERVEGRNVATRLRYRNDKWTKIFKQGGFGDEATKQIITLMDMPRDDPIYSIVGGFDRNPEELNPQKVCIFDTQESPLAKSLMAYCALMIDRIAEKKAILLDMLKDRRSGAQGLLTAKGEDLKKLKDVRLSPWPSSAVSFVCMAGWVSSINQGGARFAFKGSPFPGVGKILCCLSENMIVLLGKAEDLPKDGGLNAAQLFDTSPVEQWQWLEHQ